MSREKKIKVVLFEPNTEPKIKTIDYTLDTLQKCVHGYIECIYLTDDLVLICNDEGKMNGSLPNRRIGNDIIFDSFLVVGDAHDEDGNFRSLTQDEIGMVTLALWEPIDTRLLKSHEINEMRNCEFKIYNVH